MKHLRRLGFVALFLLAGPLWAQETGRQGNRLVFEEDIRPILKAYCFDCHGAEEELEGGLDLRLRRLALKGGDSGPAIEPGDIDESSLYQRILDGEMPPREKKLSSKDIATIGRWIADGAPTAKEEPKTIGKGTRITPEDRAFWSFRPIRRPPTPSFAAEDRVRTPIDALLNSALRAKGLSFSSDADRLTLLRRASLDLTGLPPKPAEIAAFASDTSADAYETMIDRLLTSPHYGERWGRHWLDVAGYADSEGYSTADQVRPFAYKFRDYVIRAFNADKPIDRFIVEQLAGDELVEQPYRDLTAHEIELLAATGFLRMAVDGTGSGASDQEAARNQVVSDTIQIVSTTLLGMSLACAKCHDHRHDPILQTDYYRVRAVFEPAYDWKNWRAPSQRRISLYTEADRAKATAIEAEAGKVAAERGKKQNEYIAAALDKELEKFDESLRESYRVAYYTPANKRTEPQKKIFLENPFLRLHGGNLYQYNQKSADDLKTYDERIAKIRARKPFEDAVRVLTEIPGKAPATYLFHRGDPKQPKDAIAPGGLVIAAPEGQPFAVPDNDADLPTTGRRLAYARWLTNGRHPLVSRVFVNRVWMHHFGRGLVETPSDFGAMGAKPTNPELLDRLASEFVADGWSLKRLHKRIMMSTAYRQGSRADADKEAIDPQNLLYWRKPIQRLEAETLRDRILATSGTLNPGLFGPPAPIKEDEVGQIVVADGAGKHRRSIYLQVRRSMPVSMLRQFDMPVMEINCEKRPYSTVSTQSLVMMNSGFLLDQAAHFAERLRQEVGDDPRRQIRRAWELAFARPATKAEIARARAFLDRQLELIAQQTAKGNDGKDEDEKQKKDKDTRLSQPNQQALTDLCQALLGSVEFLYVD